MELLISFSYPMDNILVVGEVNYEENSDFGPVCRISVLGSG